MVEFVDPRDEMHSRHRSNRRPAASGVDQIEALLGHCRAGRLYDVEHWIAEGKALQLGPGASTRERRSRSPLAIAMNTGQYSLCQLLLCNGYQLEHEIESPLDVPLKKRRWDLVNLLLEWGADPHEVSLDTLFDTYNLSLFEQFYAAGVKLTTDHEIARHLALHPGNKPLFGFVKRRRHDEPKIQVELDIALGYHVRQSNAKGLSLCMWAGADPYARVRDLEYGSDDDDEHESAVEGASYRGNLEALRKFRPNPSLVDFDRLYAQAANREVVALLAGIQLPHRLTGIVQNQCYRAGLYWNDQHDWRGALSEILSCGVRWSEAHNQTLAGIRFDLLKADTYALKDIVVALREPEVCAPEIYHELTRTPTMQKRMLEMGVIKPRVKPVSKAEKQRREVSSLLYRYDREQLHEQVWSHPVHEVAKSYGVSGVYLGRICRTLRVPVPPRGYWAKLRSGKTVRQRPLPALPKSVT